MAISRNLVALTALVLVASCARKPAFTYVVPPGASLERMGTFSLDPRELVWRVEGRQALEPGEFRPAVIQELQAKGFRLVKPDEAELWLDVIVTAPAGGRSGERALPSSGDTAGRGMRGARGGGAPRGNEGTPWTPMPEKTVAVKLVSRNGDQTVWFGSVEIPVSLAPAAPEEWMRRLLQPLPQRAGEPIQN